MRMPMPVVQLCIGVFDTVDLILAHLAQYFHKYPFALSVFESLRDGKLTSDTCPNVFSSANKKFWGFGLVPPATRTHHVTMGLWQCFLTFWMGLP